LTWEPTSKLTGRYTAPKSVYHDIPKPDEEADDPFAEYRKGRIADREDDYKKRRLARQLSSVSSYRERMIESAQENQKIRAVLEAEKKRKEEMEEAEKKLKERQEQLKQQEKLRRKEDKRKRKEEKKKEKRRKKRKLGVFFDYFVQCQKWIFLSLKAGQRFLQAFP